jgi:hypothetical protein
MTVGTLDRRTLLALAVGLAAVAILRFTISDSGKTPVVAASESIPLASKRLDRLRQIAATLPGKETLLKQGAAELQTRESGILKADTAAQAQAQLLDVMRRVASANGIDARGAEQFGVKPLADNYGVVSVVVMFSCGIEQLVNFLAALANEPEILATDEIHISGGSDKKKNVQVRLSLSGVVPKKLVPAKKEVASF